MLCPICGSKAAAHGAPWATGPRRINKRRYTCRGKEAHSFITVEVPPELTILALEDLDGRKAEEHSKRARAAAQSAEALARSSAAGIKSQHGSRDKRVLDEAKALTELTITDPTSRHPLDQAWR